MARNLLVTLLALAVGLGVGYLIGSARDAPVRSDRPAVETRPARPEPLPASASDLVRVLHEIPAPHYAAGTGRITGFVRDRAGNGVAGVTIRAQQRGVTGNPPKGEGVPDEETLEETVRKSVKSYHWRRQTTVNAVTDRSGAYLLDGLADREYSLQAYLEGYQITVPQHGGAWKVKPGATIDWVASPIVTVPVEVLLPDGTQPSEAWIHCSRGNNSQSEHWTPERREIRIPPGAYTFTVNLSGNDDYRSEAVETTLEAGTPADPIVFQLIGRPGIRGRIDLRAPERFSSLRVYALRYTGAEAPSKDQLGAQGKEQYAWEQNNFEFSFLDLPPGRYLVGAGAQRTEIVATQTVDVGKQMASAELVIDGFDPELYIEIRVLGPDGEPAVIDQVSTSYRTAHSSSSGGSNWARRPDGSYVVCHHNHGYEEGGTYGVEITSKQYGKKSLEYQRGKEREFEVRFRAPATLAVTVAGFKDSEHADRIQLGLSRPAGKRGLTSVTGSEAPDGDGRAVLGPVESGDYELVIHVRIGRHQTMPAVRRPVTLTAGESDLTLPMPVLHELVVLGAKGTNCTLRTDREAGFWFHQSQRCGDDGRATFGPLPAGTYTLQQSGEQGEMTVKVPCGEVAFRASEYNALKVSIHDANGMLARAGLADGDLIVGIAGQSFSGRAQMQMLFAAAMMRGEDTTLTIVRGGRTLELTVDLKGAMQNPDGGPGGSVRPTVR